MILITISSRFFPCLLDLLSTLHVDLVKCFLRICLARPCREDTSYFWTMPQDSTLLYCMHAATSCLGIKWRIHPKALYKYLIQLTGINKPKGRTRWLLTKVFCRMVRKYSAKKSLNRTNYIKEGGQCPSRSCMHHIGQLEKILNLPSTGGRGSKE